MAAYYAQWFDIITGYVLPFRQVLDCECGQPGNIKECRALLVGRQVAELCKFPLSI